MGSAYLVVVIIVYHYCLAFDPRRTRTPRARDDNPQTEADLANASAYHNPLDVAVIDALQGFGPRYIQQKISRERLEIIFEKATPP